MTARQLSGDIGVSSDGPSLVDADAYCDEQWRRVMEAFEDLADAYYGEGRALADAHIADIVMRFVRQCHEMKQRIISATAESPYFSPTALHHFWSNTRALDICDALVDAEELAAKRSPKVTARIHRTYTEPHGRAFAIIEYAREGEPPRTADAMVVAENYVNAWTRFIRKQRSAGRNFGAQSDHR
ncbi:MAG TPA: hypothetical protein VM282_26555 [Acidimicrobiales bacterium]|nr:hypothetical protein [Acidimicrobiales bacterium]